MLPEIAVDRREVYDELSIPDSGIQLKHVTREGEGMTQPSKKGRSRKMARAIARRKRKASIKRQSAAKYAARTGREVPVAT
jgi:hypothetical protein